MTRHLLDVDDLTPAELIELLDRCVDRARRQLLTGRGMALLFEKPSARTRHSTEMAVVQLGGHPVYVRPDEVGLDVRETTEDVARTLACYHALSVPGCSSTRSSNGWLRSPAVPVVNLLSNQSHPLAGDRRPAHHPVGVRWVRRPHGRLGRRLQQRGPLAGPRRRPWSAWRCGSSARPATGRPMSTIDQHAPCSERPTWSHESPASEAGRTGSTSCATDAWYSMGQEDAGRGADARRSKASPSISRSSTVRPPHTRSCCTACPPTVARRSAARRRSTDRQPGVGAGDQPHARRDEESLAWLLDR